MQYILIIYAMLLGDHEMPRVRRLQAPRLRCASKSCSSSRRKVQSRKIVNKDSASKRDVCHRMPGKSLKRKTSKASGPDKGQEGHEHVYLPSGHRRPYFSHLALTASLLDRAVASRLSASCQPEQGSCKFYGARAGE